jgi:hypothetical protein
MLYGMSFVFQRTTDLEHRTVMPPGFQYDPIPCYANAQFDRFASRLRFLEIGAELWYA